MHSLYTHKVPVLVISITNSLQFGQIDDPSFWSFNIFLLVYIPIVSVCLENFYVMYTMFHY